MDKRQREYYLREQLKAIQEELGETMAIPLAELESRLDELTESVLVARLADRVQNKKNKCKAVY